MSVAGITAYRPLVVLVAAPYPGEGDTGSEGHAADRAVRSAALAVFQAGHTPVTGLAIAPTRAAPAEAQHRYLVRILPRCDAVLRAGGASADADELIELARWEGKVVYQQVADIPVLAPPWLGDDLAVLGAEHRTDG